MTDFLLRGYKLHIRQDANCLLQEIDQTSVSYLLQFLYSKTSTEMKNLEEALSDEGVGDQEIF